MLRYSGVPKEHPDVNGQKPDYELREQAYEPDARF